MGNLGHRRCGIFSGGCVALIFALTTFVVGDFTARADEGSARFESLKVRYLRIRNIDPEVHRPAEWASIASDFETFVARYPRAVDAPQALFNQAVVFEQLYRTGGDSALLLQSVAHLKRLVKEYPADEHADDALLRAADFFAFDLESPEGAKQLYQRLIDRYPRSDSSEVARARLRSLAAGEFFAPGRIEDKPVARGVVVVLDPGHGGEDVGARGIGGLLEKDVTLAVALEVERLLAAQTDVAVFLTRRTDTFVPLLNRTAFANEKKADLFLSLHVNASPTGALKGLQTFVLDPDGDEASRLLAERENVASRSAQNQDGSGASDLEFILSDLTQRGKLEPSLLLAQMVQRSLINRMRRRWDFVRDLGISKAPFYVLVGAHMPCVLVEMFFINHPVDGLHLGERDFRSDLASGITAGIQEYLHTDRHVFKPAIEPQ